MERIRGEVWGRVNGHKRVGVIGDPVAHSLSPVFQQAAFDAPVSPPGTSGGTRSRQSCRRGSLYFARPIISAQT